MKAKETRQRFGLTESTIEQITSVFEQYPDLEEAILYGSRAMGNYRKGSDIDLTLKGESLTYRQMVQMEVKIDDLLLPYLFDFSLLRHIEDRGVVDHIERVGVTFYKRHLTAPEKELASSQSSTSRPL